MQAVRRNSKTIRWKFLLLLKSQHSHAIDYELRIWFSLSEVIVILVATYNKYITVPTNGMVSMDLWIFIFIFLLNQAKKNNASPSAHFQTNLCVFLNRSLGDLSRRRVLILSFNVARVLVWLNQTFCCVIYTQQYTVYSKKKITPLRVIILSYNFCTTQPWIRLFAIMLTH